MNNAIGITGVASLKPQRQTEGVTTLELLMRVSSYAAKDAGLSPSDIDGLLVCPQVGETPSMCQRLSPSTWGFSRQWRTLSILVVLPERE